MCGFVGFTNTTSVSDKKTPLNAMMDAIVHRGPDSAGEFIDKRVALGFRRLSIIDLEGGDQPIFNEDGTKVIVFNGEIYNYQPIREELLGLGHTFKTNSDTEVLIHGYEQWGTDLLSRLRGMFAFAIYDKNDGSVFIARDMFGIKPLYYGVFKESLIFGSEIKSFLHHPHFEKKLNREQLSYYLSFQYSPGEETFFTGVKKLLPGHSLLYKEGNIEINKYFTPSFEPTKEEYSEQKAEEIEKVFFDSIAAHKISDVEVGSFLSSGIDSSYAASAAKVDKTFTVGFKSPDGDKYNEISYAKELSEHIGVKNFDHIITPDEYWDSLSKIQYHMDEPLADASCVALYFVSKEAAKHVKVALSGEGADEFFGGYNVYREPIENTGYTKIPYFIRRAVGAIAEHLPQKYGINYLVRNSRRFEDRYVGNAFIFSQKEQKKLLAQKSDRKPFTAMTAPYFDDAKDYDPVTTAQYIDMNFWLVGDILLKADKMSMANSLEVRVPFLDKEVFNYAKSLSLADKIHGTQTKYALREAAKRTIPQKSADKKKLGFPVPIRVWLKEEKYYNIVKQSFESPAASEFFNVKAIVKLLDKHKSGKADNSRKIWTIFCFLIWHKEFFENE